MRKFLSLGIILAAGGCTTMGGNAAIPAPDASSVPAPSGLGDTAAPGTASSTAIIAALEPGILGAATAARLSESERARALEAEYRALEYGQPGEVITWTSPRSGISGEVKALLPYQVGSQNCRAYEHTVHLQTGSRTARGTACRNADGSWITLT